MIGKLDEIFTIGISPSDEITNLKFGAYQMINRDNMPGSKFGLLVSFNITDFAYKGFLFFDIPQGGLYYCSYNSRAVANAWKKIG